MYDVDFDLTVHIRGTVCNVEEKPKLADEILEHIFPYGWEGEILGVQGEIEVANDDEEGENP